ncbi:hypothetical protein K438DRAFT_1976307 [Mycena galopus ATCC 62051]|nr:hypothetical protein K438DRAFT_1976307 [Mycena galopus ATCC 62051]
MLNPNPKPGNVSGYQDPWWIKLLVAFLFIANTTQASAVVYLSWFYCVTNFANPRVVSINLWPYPFTGLITAILAIINQMLQSWRIYLFTGNKILIGFLVATSVAACGTGIIAAIKAWIFSEQAKLVLLQPIVEVNLALQCAIDVIIAVQSGFFTAVFALGILFSFRFSETYMMSLFALPIGRIYTHTMMDHFVSRERLRDTLSNGGNIITVPNFNVLDASCAPSEGPAILLRNISIRTNTNETV